MRSARRGVTCWARPEHRNGEPLAHPADRAVVVGGKAAGVSVELGTDGWHHSPQVIAASLGSAVVLAAIIQTPGVSQFFGCRPLGPLAWGIGIAASAGATVMAPVLASIASTDSLERLTHYLESYALQ